MSVRDLRVDCVSGVACMTGSPGACAAGHVVCADNVAICQADVTTQACYTGPAATRGVGACKSGTQSCTGSLGACAGQVLPATEDCFNDLDDDCDGVVNNGCPDHVALGAAHALTPHGSGSGSPMSAQCPAGQIVMYAKFYGDDSNYMLSGIEVWCSAPKLDRDTTQRSYALNVPAPDTSAAAAASALGSNISPSYYNFAFTCPAGQLGNWTKGTAGSALRAIAVGCATSALTQTGATLTPTFTRASAVLYGYQTSDPSFEDDCAANEVLVGYNLYVGAVLYQIQSVCAPLTIVNK